MSRCGRAGRPATREARPGASDWHQAAGVSPPRKPAGRPESTCASFWSATGGARDEPLMPVSLSLPANLGQTRELAVLEEHVDGGSMRRHGVDGSAFSCDNGNCVAARLPVVIAIDQAAVGVV